MNKITGVSATFFFLLVISNLGAQSKKDSSDSTFDKIFGISRLEKYNTDTLIAPSKRKIIYSGAECKLTIYNEKGQVFFIRNLIEKQCGLLAFMLVDPKEHKKIKKGCEVLLQFKDKTIYCINLKTGAFHILDL